MAFYPKWSKRLCSFSVFHIEAVGLDPSDEVPRWFWTCNDVERRGQRAALLKVAHPKFCSGKLPLNISMILRNNQREELNMPTKQ